MRECCHHLFSKKKKRKGSVLSHKSSHHYSPISDFWALYWSEHQPVCPTLCYKPQTHKTLRNTKREQVNKGGNSSIHTNLSMEHGHSLREIYVPDLELHTPQGYNEPDCGW